MSDKLPYRSFQEINPNKIIVDIFGAASNSVWITQLQSVKTIANVNYEQIEDDVLRIFSRSLSTHFTQRRIYKSHLLGIWEK